MHVNALILFYLNKEPINFDETAKYWKYIEVLDKLHLLPVAQVPLELKTR